MLYKLFLFGVKTYERFKLGLILKIFMKMAIIVRTDLEMGKGKIAAQASHAAVEAAFKANKMKFLRWKLRGQKKVVLKVKDLKELEKYTSRAKKEKINTVLIRDAGLTQISPGSVTVAALGPDDDTKVDRIVSDLKLL